MLHLQSFSIRINVFVTTYMYSFMQMCVCMLAIIYLSHPCSLSLCVTIISVMCFETPVPGAVHNSVYITTFLQYTAFSGSGLIEPCGPIRAFNQKRSQAQPPGLHYYRYKLQL